MCTCVCLCMCMPRQFVLSVRVVWGIIMLATNGYMLELFVRSLHAVGSVATTVIHLVANFSFTVRTPIVGIVVKPWTAPRPFRARQGQPCCSGVALPVLTPVVDVPGTDRRGCIRRDASIALRNGCSNHGAWCRPGSARDWQQ